MNDEIIFEFETSMSDFGICKLNICNFVIMITELYENGEVGETHTFQQPEIVIQDFCQKKNLDANKVLCICHIGEESYSPNADISIIAEIYKIFKFNTDKDGIIISTKRSNFPVRKELVDLIFKKAEEPNMSLEKLEKDLDLCLD